VKSYEFWKCRNILALIMIILSLICIAVEMICPLYFDNLVKYEGSKLAGMLGAEFEQQEGSPYYN
jgi:hypothetical protein